MQRFYDAQIEIEDIYNRMIFYRERLFEAHCPYGRMFYEKLILDEIERLIETKKHFMRVVKEVEIQSNREVINKKEFTIEELAKYTGAGGKPAFVAVNGIVYDVSLSASWGGGTHFGLYSGKNLTKEFMSCHNNMMQILNKLPKVGIMKP